MWFRSFLLKASVSRVNRRICIRIAWIGGQTGGPRPDAPTPPTTTTLVGDRGPSALSLVLGGGADVLGVVLGLDLFGAD